MLNFQFMDLKTCFLSLYALLIFLEHMVLQPAFQGFVWLNLKLSIGFVDNCLCVRHTRCIVCLRRYRHSQCIVCLRRYHLQTFYCSIKTHVFTLVKEYIINIMFLSELYTRHPCNQWYFVGVVTDTLSKLLTSVSTNDRYSNQD